MNWKCLFCFAPILCWALSGCRTAAPIASRPAETPPAEVSPAHPAETSPAETHPAESHPVETPQWGPVVDGLKMSLSVKTNVTPTDPELDIAIQNMGTNDIALDLGIMLANGKYQLPDNIGLNITDSLGKLLKLNFFDRRFGAIGGRVDDYAIPLRAGSTYTLEVQLDQFWSGEAGIWGMKLGPGTYNISAELQGTNATIINSGTSDLRLMNFWKGKLQSNSVTVTE
jgi:hypothetical protein